MTSKLTDEKLHDEYDSARRSMSYYNAAESNWHKETADRNKARAYLIKVKQELDKRGLEGRPGEFLC